MYMPIFFFFDRLWTGCCVLIFFISALVLNSFQCIHFILELAYWCRGSSLPTKREQWGQNRLKVYAIIIYLYYLYLYCVSLYMKTVRTEHMWCQDLAMIQLKKKDTQNIYLLILTARFSYQFFFFLKLIHCGLWNTDLNMTYPFIIDNHMCSTILCGSSQRQIFLLLGGCFPQHSCVRYLFLKLVWI